MLDYIRDGQEIYRRSFATIRAEANLDGIPADLEKLAVRVIHACGMVDVVQDLRFSPSAGAAGRAALLAGAPILCDARMVAEGITRPRLPANNPVICTLHDAGVPELAKQLGNTPAVCRKCYIHPAVVEKFMLGALAELPRPRVRKGLRAEEVALAMFLERMSEMTDAP